MGISANRFELQPRSQREVEDWVRVLVRALSRASKGWHLAIVHREEEITFECSPPLTNEEVAAAYQEADE